MKVSLLRIVYAHRQRLLYHVVLFWLHLFSLNYEYIYTTQDKTKISCHKTTMQLQCALNSTQHNGTALSLIPTRIINRNTYFLKPHLPFPQPENTSASLVLCISMHQRNVDIVEITCLFIFIRPKHSTENEKLCRNLSEPLPHGLAHFTFHNTFFFSEWFI